MNAAVILSGGIGSRLGADIPKQYIEVNGKMIITYSLSTFIAHPLIDVIVVVADHVWAEDIRRDLSGLECELRFALPGKTRQFSILNGLTVLHNEYSDMIKKVVIHDAARPLVKAALIDDCLTSCDFSYQGSMPVLPVKDTIYQSFDSDTVSALLDRSTLFAGQSPEAFMFIPYLAAHRNLSFEELARINGSSELAFKAGLKIKLIVGDPLNFKITDRNDLRNFKMICDESKCLI